MRQRSQRLFRCEEMREEFCFESFLQCRRIELSQIPCAFSSAQCQHQMVERALPDIKCTERIYRGRIDRFESSRRADITRRFGELGPVTPCYGHFCPEDAERLRRGESDP